MKTLFVKLGVTIAASLAVATAAMAPSASASTSASAIPRLAAGAAKVSPAAASGTISYADMEGYWIAAGGPADQASTAAAIAAAESSSRPGVIQAGVDYCGNDMDKAGWGLWQITCGDSVPQFGQNFQLLDPWNNAEAAVAKYNAAGSFIPWVQWQKGTYRSFLQDVPPNLAVTDPGEFIQDGSTPNGTPSSPAPAPGSTYGPGIPGGHGFTGGVSTLINGGNVWTMGVESDGRLHEIIQTPDGISDGPVGTATFIGGVSSLLNGGNVWTMAVESDHQLHEVIQTPTGLSDDVLDPATFTGGVSSIINGGNVWTMAVESDGELHEIIQTPAGITDNALSPATFTGGVSSVLNGGNVWTMAVESDGRLHEIIQTPDGISDGPVGTGAFRQS